MYQTQGLLPKWLLDETRMIQKIGNLVWEQINFIQKASDANQTGFRFEL